MSVEEAAAVLAAMAKGDSSNSVAAALMEKGGLEQTESAEDESEAPTIVVSDVTFKVGDKIENSDAYVTELSFKVVIENNAENGITTVTVIDGEGNQVQSSDLSTLAVVDGKYVMPGLQLAENVNYNLQFDFAAEQTLGADAYVYNATIETTDYVETETEVRVNVSNEAYNGPAGEVPSGDYEIGKSSNKNNAQIHFNGENKDSAPASGNYTVIDSDGRSYRATMRHNSGQLFIEMNTPENGDNFIFIEDGKNEGCLTLIDEDGNVSTLVVYPRNGGGNGLNNYDGGQHDELFTTVKTLTPVTETENYEYGFGYDKSQSLSASQNMTLNFSVEESTVSSDMVSSSETKVDTDKTTVKEWVKDEWEELKPIDEDPAEEPEAPAVVPANEVYEVGENEIAEEPVPLASAPKTGSESLIFAIAAAVSGMGLAGMAIIGKRKED